MATNNPWLEAALAVFGLQHLYPYVEDIFDEPSGQYVVNPKSEVQAALSEAIQSIGEGRASPQSLYYPVHAAAREAVRELKGWEYNPYLNYLAGRIAEIDPAFLYGLYNTGEATTDPQQIAAWYQAFTRGLLGAPMGQPMTFEPANTTREATALLAANLAPGSETNFAYALREAVRQGRHFDQFMLLRGALQGTTIATMYGAYQDLMLNALGDLYEQYLLDVSAGKVSRDMSFVEYVAVFGADRIGHWFPGMRWDQLDDLWAAWRAQEAGKTAQTPQPAQVPVEQPPAQPQPAPAPVQASSPSGPGWTSGGGNRRFVP